MGTYNIPRNVKGEGRILFIFSGKSMIYITSEKKTMTDSGKRIIRSR